MPTKETIPLNFQNLTPVEKVRAILCGVPIPVTKTLALDLSGVNYDQLDETTQNEIDVIFSDNQIITSKYGNESRYRFNQTYRTQHESTVDMDSVHDQITFITNSYLGIKPK